MNIVTPSQYYSTRQMSPSYNKVNSWTTQYSQHSKSSLSVSRLRHQQTGWTLLLCLGENAHILKMLTQMSGFKFIYFRSVTIHKQGDLDDVREITAVWCWSVKKTKFRGGHLGFLAAISQSILTKFSTHI